MKMPKVLKGFNAFVDGENQVRRNRRILPARKSRAKRKTTRRAAR